MAETLASFRDRALQVIEIAFGGEHHVHEIRWADGSGYPYCEFKLFERDLATWDYEGLTALVVAAHDQCVRAELRPVRKEFVVFISDRVRESHEHPMTLAHPTLEDHVAAVRRQIDRLELNRRMGYAQPGASMEVRHG